ncbi:unnamed protein product [Rhizoctonia solani]|uniref:WD40 repeat-like protein n=1 Tax=Rhizoctonia solani TaxID=456999 RepID=A0A8H2XHW3_9AGAM|nr:unnamed protein product [Rhizoctonia solani]
MAVEGHDDETKDACVQCIGVILATSEHDSIDVPDLLHPLLMTSNIDEYTFHQIIKSLGPLLVVKAGQHIRFHHPSFRGFITDPSRSGDFSVSIDQFKAEPAVYCLKVMQRDLRFNICNLETLHVPNRKVSNFQDQVQTHVGSALRYSCRHWIDLFIESPNQELVEAIKKFMDGPQLIYWIEVLSLTGGLESAITGLSKLMTLELAQFDGWDLVVAWTKDIHRFILSFYDIIATSTPHLYISALAFAPSNSHTFQIMRTFFPNTVTVSRGGDTFWHPCIKTIFHPHTVKSLSLSPDGLKIVTGYSDGSISIWDKQTGSRIGDSLLGHTNSVTCVRFLASGNLVVSSSRDGTVQVWDLREKSPTTNHVATGHFGSVNCVAFSPKDTFIALGSSDKTIRLWDTKSMHSIGEPYTGHSSGVSCIAFSSDGTKLVSGSLDKTIRIWLIDMGGQQFARSTLLITGHSDAITCVAITIDGTKVASGSVDRTVRLWDALSSQKITNHISSSVHSTSITCVSFSSRGDLLISSSVDGEIQLRNVTTFEQVFCPCHHADSVNEVTFSPDSLQVISASNDMTTRIWDIGELPQPMTTEPLLGHSNYVHSVAVSNNGTHIVSGSSDHTIRMWNAQTGALIGEPLIGHSGQVSAVAISPDRSRIVSGGYDKTLKLWDTANHAVFQSHNNTHAIVWIALSPDGALIAFGGEDYKVQLWDVINWKPIGNPLQEHSSHVLSIAFSPDGKLLASALADQSVIVWDVRTQNRLGSPLKGHTQWVRSVVFSPCGNQLATGSEDHTVRLWDRKSGNSMHTMTGHSGHVMAVCFSPNGLHIASGSHDKTVRLWDTKTGQLIGHAFTEHSGEVTSLAFTSDGRHLISGSHDKSVRIRSIDGSGVVHEREEVPPDVYCWPSNPHELSSHPHHPGWVVDDQGNLAFWLPPHHQQPAQFLSPRTQAPYPQTFLDYSRFVHGTAWTNVASDFVRHGST